MTKSACFLKSGTFTGRKYNSILVASIGAWFIALVDGCADSILAGAFLNEMAVSAISLVQPISSVVSFLAYLVSVGTAIMFSRECGAFRREKGYEYVGQGVICSVVISVLLVAAMVLLRGPLLAFYGASGQITGLAEEYYMCEIFFAAVYPLYFIVYQLVLVDGDEIFTLLACIASAASNVIASLLLVGTLGVRGLAYGTIIGTVSGLAVYCMHFLRRTNSVRIRLHFNVRELGDVVKISSSTSMTLLYIAVIDIVMNKFIITHYGDIYLPAYAVVNFIINLGAIFCSLYDAGSGFISVAFGENNPVGIRQTMKISCRALAVMSAAMLVILELAAPVVPNLYGIANSQVRDASVFATRVIALSCPAIAVYYLFSTYYAASGHVWMGHLIAALYMLITPLVLAIPLGIAFGFNGLSVGFMLTAFVSVLVTAGVIRLKYGRKAVPLMLDESGEERLSYELYLTGEGIATLCEEISGELSSRGISPSVVNEVQLILEESYMTILEENGVRKVLTQCDLLISCEKLRLITRDNGRIFDITDANARVKNLRSYVLALYMEQNPERNNTTTISFNRNSYCWNLHE